MQKLKSLLDLSTTEASFDAGSIEMPREGITISHASRPQDLVSPEQWATMIATTGWEAEEFHRASSAHPIIRHDLFSDLEHQVRRLLQDLIDPETDRIGHAFPIGGSEERSFASTRPEVPGGLRQTRSWSSPVVNLVRALVKGAAAMGPEAAAAQLQRWLEGADPIRYREAALLNGVAFIEALDPVPGVHIEPLPLTPDELPVHLPKSNVSSADYYLGRTVLYIEHEASPALFRPGAIRWERSVESHNVAGIDFGTACQALSLESNTNVEAGFFWSHYHGPPGLSQPHHGGSWAFGTRFELWPLTGGKLTERFTEGAGALFPDGNAGPKPSEDRLGDTIRAIKALGADDAIRTAISRWMGSKDQRPSVADRFIDLRIALEALYLKDFLNEKTSQEMRFRLPLFGAWHVGENFVERQQLRKMLRESYDRASTAVHTGSVAGASAKLLADGQDICRRGIVKLLKEGRPRDWGDLILGAQYANRD